MRPPNPRLHIRAHPGAGAGPGPGAVGPQVNTDAILRAFTRDCSGATAGQDRYALPSPGTHSACKWLETDFAFGFAFDFVAMSPVPASRYATLSGWLRA